MSDYKDECAVVWKGVFPRVGKSRHCIEKIYLPSKSLTSPAVYGDNGEPIEQGDDIRDGDVFEIIDGERRCVVKVIGWDKAGD
jgi:hypothetical protein